MGLGSPVSNIIGNRFGAKQITQPLTWKQFLWNFSKTHKNESNQI